MVTTSEGMVNGVHDDRGNDGPHLPLGLEHPELLTGLQDGLFVTASAADDSDHSAGISIDSLTNARGQFYSGGLTVLALADDGGVGSGGSGELAGVAFLGLNVADESTFGNSANGQDVSDGELGLGAAIDVLSSVHAFSSEIKFFDGFVAVGVAELDSGQGSASSRVVEDFSDDAADVAVSFGEIETSESSGADTVESAGLVNGAFGVTLLLGSYTSSHWSL